MVQFSDPHRAVDFHLICETSFNSTPRECAVGIVTLDWSSNQMVRFFNGIKIQDNFLWFLNG